MNVFLTGTDTDVGKTYVATRLVRALRSAGRDCVGFKPVCCGSRGDAEGLHAASGGSVTLNEVNPLWLRAPLAPYAAGMVENRVLDLALVHESFARLRGSHESIIVEGAGGWRVPITRDYCMSDLAADFGLPVLVIAANRLGALNHTLLTVESIRARGLQCAGVILNRPKMLSEEEEIVASTNAALLDELLDVPVHFEMQHGQEALLAATLLLWMPPG